MNCVAGFRGIMLSASINGCAHNCRYCLVGKHEREAIMPFDAFAQLAEKFVSWREANPGAMNVFINMRYSFECPVERLVWFIRQRARCGQTMDSLLLGGLCMRPERETAIWLARRRDAGIRTVIASFAGPGEMHDFWNGRQGDFEHLIGLLQCSAELEMHREERLFITRGSLPVIDKLVSRLDELPGKPATRVVSLFMYRGRAKELEAERITIRERDTMPEYLRAMGGRFSEWRSEKEWIDLVSNENETLVPQLLHLGVDKTNVTELLQCSCDEIVAGMEARTKAAYAAIPSRKELCKLAGERSNERIYSGIDSMERLWLDRFLDAHPVKFERNLTHLSTW